VQFVALRCTKRACVFSIRSSAHKVTAVPTSTIPPAPRSYSTVEIARRLGVSIQTVQRWVDAGHLKAWKTLGGHRRIDADSAERLLRHELTVGRHALAPTAPALAAPLAGGIQPSTVLIVDDHQDDRDILQHLVLSALPSAQVTAVASGFEALVCIGRQSPDVLIADIMMPNMSGIEMLRHLAHGCAARPKTIWAVSNHTRDELLNLGELPDDVYFQSKPLDRDRFCALLRNAVSLESASV
jgi:excisionase family DNA binding protein